MKVDSQKTPNLRTFRSRPDVGGARHLRGRFAGAELDSIKSQRPLVVEIGCGVGLHPVQYVQREPKKHIVAIERTREKFDKFAGRLKTHPHLSDRICAVHADAIHFLDLNFSDASLDEVWILYPNPETAKTTRRWFQSPFTSRLTELMRPGATLYFATNLEDYANSVLELASTYALKEVKIEKICRSSFPEFQPRSHFEKKYFERDETIFNFEFRLERPED